MAVWAYLKFICNTFPSFHLLTLKIILLCLDEAEDHIIVKKDLEQSLNNDSDKHKSSLTYFIDFNNKI